LRKHDLPHAFSNVAKRQAAHLPAEVRAADRKGRVDVTKLALVTIDGETAKDFDDAVYCERVGKGFRLVVAIADVSHYSHDAQALLPHVQNLHALYKLLSAARAKRGAIDFDTVELALEFDTRGKIEAIVPVARNDAHKLIEECMLAANVCTAGYLLAQKQPALFRVHQGPTPEKLEALKEFLAGSGLSLSGGNNPTSADYARLLEKIRGRPDFNLLQTVLLRSLQQAVYSPENVGHFGL